MSEKKPSLFVVERKELIILIILFVLITIGMFVLGVKYGKILGKDSAKTTMQAEESLADHNERTGQGSLDKAAEHASDQSHGDGQGEHHAVGSNDSGHAVESEHADGSHNQPHAEEVSPEAMAKKDGDAHDSSDQAHKDAMKPVDVQDSDAALLEALEKANLDEEGSGQSADLPETQKKASATEGSLFVIQVGSFPTRSDAERQKKKLLRSNLSSRILDPVQQSGGTWHRVVIGQYSSRNAAETDAMKYKQSGVIKSYFVREIN